MIFSGVVALCLSMPLSVRALTTDVLNQDRVQANPVVEVDFYRAMGSWEDTEENDDLGDILGVLKYVHLEVIPEHIEDPSRTTRKNNITAIGHWRFKVKNPMDLLVSVEVRSQDFGPFMTFDGGQNTNPDHDELIRNYGDVVGIQPQSELSIEAMVPYFWYSISGFCPNLPFECTQGYPGCPDTSFDTQRCSLEPQGCPGKGDLTTPDEQCIQYATGGVVEGGLCEGGANSNIDPTGSTGCAYTYTQGNQVLLDVVTGITEEDCGGRTCADWHDFRYHCTNREYKRKFDAKGNLVNSPTCVEYDVHPACQLGCAESNCTQASVQEVGLPFWLGRCNATATMIRAEAVADAFGIPGAETEHQLLAQDLRPESHANQLKSCKWAGASTMCNPNPDTGGTYCTRSWGSACQACYIPGTVSDYPDPTLPLCPLDIINTPDYQDLSPNCRDLESPIGLCCLYLENSCLGNGTGDGAALDFSGFLLVAARKSTADMARFLFRLYNASASSEQMIVDEVRLNESAYWQWQMDVIGKPWLNDPQQNVESIISEIALCFAPASSPPDPVLTTPAPGSQDPASWAPVIVVICILIVAGTIGVVWYRKKLQAQSRVLIAESSLPQRR